MKTPQMKTGRVEMVSVEWIMQNANSSVDGYTVYDNGATVDYEGMMAGKSCDPQMGPLVHTIIERGFRVPIVLDLVDDGIMHGNGHHRMIAAILLCLDEVPVYWANGDYMSEHASDTEELTYSEKDVDFIYDLLYMS